jgi:pyruvate dehydrogenase E1 component beta subunit
MVVEEFWRTGGFAGELASRIQEEVFDFLDGPVGRVGGIDVPTPYSRKLEAAVVPDAGRIIRAAHELFGL